MHFTKFAVKNYKSFFDWTECRLSKGINLIVGKNSSGKSALLDLLTLQVSNNPHKSIISKPKRRSLLEEDYCINCTISYSHDDIMDSLSKRVLKFPISEIYARGNPNWQEHIKNWLINLSEDTRSSILFRGEVPEKAIIPESYPCVVDVGVDNFVCCPISIRDGTEEFIFHRPNKSNGTGWFFPSSQAVQLSEQTFRFSAERFLAHTCPLQSPRVLQSNASNLPKVISELSGEFGIYRLQEFNTLTNEVFPEIHEVGAVSRGQDLSLFVYNEDPKLKRNDLKVHLQDCGNGIGQVLAILYILVTSTEPRVILIDEPTSFLHSEATRKLMEILARYPQHQIIIATHSPLVVNTVNVNTVTRVVQEDGVSRLEPLEPPNEYGYQGWTVEQILRDVMQLEDTRSQVYHDAVAEFERALDDEDPQAAQAAFEKLDMMLHPEDVMRKLLKLQMTSLAGINDDQD